MTASKISKGAAKFAAGAVGTAVVARTMGALDWRVLAGAAALGGLGGLFGVDVAKLARAKMTGGKNA